MVRIVIAFFILFMVAILVPRYDLYERESEWSEKFVLHEKGFWSKDACMKAGAHLSNDAHCVQTTTWDGLWGHQEVYK